MRECPKCYQQNSFKYSYCLQCGEKLPSFFNGSHVVTLALTWVIAISIVAFFSLPEKQIAKTKKTTSTPIPTITPTTTPTPEELPPEINPDETYKVQVAMPDGSTANFGIYLLSKGYVWVKESETTVKGLGNLSKGRWITALSPELQEKIRKCPEIIVVGTADIRNKDLKRENDRAGNRSRTLYEVVTGIRGSEQTAYNWNLGQWNDSKKDDYDDQRRVIFIEVSNRTRGFDIKQGVRMALEKFQYDQPIFKDMLNSYSKSKEFDIK
jgi:hypothetical protein